MIKAPKRNKGEIVALRTLRSKTFDLGNGEHACCSTVGIAHAPDSLTEYKAKRKFKWLDPKIKVTKSGNFYVIRGGWFKARVDISNMSVVYTSADGATLKMKLLKIGNTAPTAPSKITVANGYITWHDVAPDVDIQLQFRPARMEWFKRMKSANAARSFEWRIQEDINNRDKFDTHGTGHDNEYGIGNGNKRNFKSTTNLRLVKTVAGVTTSIFTETWDGTVTQEDPNTRIKTKVSNPVYPVLLDASVVANISINNDDGDQGGYGYWRFNGTDGYNRITWHSVYPTSYRAGFRFQNIVIPQGATVTSASLDLVKIINSAANISADFYGEATDNALEWAGTTPRYRVSGLAKTTAKTTESGTQWGYTGTLSVDILTVVQELVNRAGWVSGNAMRIACPNPIGGILGGQKIYDYSKAGTPNVAQLNIVYSAGGTAYTLVADAGTYTQSGTAAGLSLGRKLSSNSGVYTLVGQAVSLQATRKLGASSGTYNLVGTDATLTYTPVGGYTLIAEGGGYILLGTSAGLSAGRGVSGLSGTYLLTGTGAVLGAVRKLTVATGNFAYTGKTVDLSLGYKVTALVGAYTQSGTNATLTWSGAPVSTGGPDIKTAGTVIPALKSESALPVQLTVSDGSGGVAGLSVTMQVRDSAGSTSYLDTNDMTFKTSGWASRDVSLIDLGNGIYTGTLSLSSITNLPGGSYLTLEYTVSGTVSGVVTDLVIFDPAVYAPQVLTVGKFIGLS